MVEMEPVMWREGDLFRQRQKEAASGGGGGRVNMAGVSSSMGSMGLGGKRPKRNDSQAKEVGDRAAADSAAEEGKTQGDTLRAMRAKNAAATGGGSAKKDTASWDCGAAAKTRLARK